MKKIFGVELNIMCVENGYMVGVVECRDGLNCSFYGLELLIFVKVGMMLVLVLCDV